MKQALVKKGIVIGEEVPAPIVSKGSVLIKVVNSCISAGTELSGVAASGTPLIRRIMDQPQKIAKVINLARSEGIMKVYRQVRGEIEAGKPTGYSISGVVIGVGEGVTKFQPGDHVAAAGGGLANHAEYVDVPVNLVVKMPEDLDFKKASTVTLGAIALQGVRRAELKLGEFCVVTGTGILGLLTIQLLRVSGIRVIAIDPDKNRLELAKKVGAELTLDPADENIIKQVQNYTNGHGTDAVIFTAATSSSEPLSQAFQMCRRKGRVILVGVSGMTIDRKDIYPKEIDFLISTSYGPGRYDKQYEEKGIDYPYSYVRWTENRNLEEYLRLISRGEIDIDLLIDKIYPVDNVTEAFSIFKSSEKRPLMVILDYGLPVVENLISYAEHKRKIEIAGKIDISRKPLVNNIINIAVIGAGNFATAVHLPNLATLKNWFSLYAVVDKQGNKAKAVADQYGAVYATTNIDDIIKDDKVTMVLITTPHDSHAEITLKALQAGKHVFVEKPLATNLSDLESIEAFYKEDQSSAKPLLMVGFNRRFSPYATEIKKHTDARINPLFIHYRMNAGYIPLDHWVHENGGRIVGEACHIIDLAGFLTGKPVVSISYDSMEPSTGKFSKSDNKSFILKYEDGSIATIEYLAAGNRDLSKEYMEIHFDEKSIVMNDYKSMQGFGLNIKEIKTASSQKGHLEEWLAFHRALTGKENSWPIPLAELFQTTRVSILISQSVS
jgi:predicted dehydrogenase/threonine dehydrogenase-like Zn-dependent dehydrogenase